MSKSAKQHRQFIQDIIFHLQDLAIILERQGYPTSCYVLGNGSSASFMVSLGDNHLIRFLVSENWISWTEMQNAQELIKLEGSEAIHKLQELSNLVRFNPKTKDEYSDEIDRASAVSEINRVLASLNLLLT
ncbi:DUF1815 family protein [Nostoc sp. FACHB-145]|uniref:DUF1815 family protein n=1 Tax=Nostoc sp. FACHB-145 TaxID=2692836 RepID=UPI0016831886|nr:DUF1815 family protein [Nostoc sp. FACHB-145]MBD2472676.1 DUF1815 family protein [Nostoc sp. FACHB-145]